MVHREVGIGLWRKTGTGGRDFSGNIFLWLGKKKKEADRFFGVSLRGKTGERLGGVLEEGKGGYFLGRKLTKEKRKVWEDDPTLRNPSTTIVYFVIFFSYADRF